MFEGKRYYWLKLQRDFFSSKRIKKLRKDLGDTSLTIYLKMQLKSITSDGLLEYTGIEDTLEEEIALDIDEPVEAVKNTTEFLIKHSLAEMRDKSLFLPYAITNTGSETASAQRSRDYRGRRNSDMLQCNTNATGMQHGTNVEKEIELEKEIEKDNKYSVHNIGSGDGRSKENIDYGNVDDLPNITRL